MIRCSPLLAARDEQARLRADAAAARVRAALARDRNRPLPWWASPLPPQRPGGDASEPLSDEHAVEAGW